MKKIDLHIHTIPTCSDSPFEFCMDTLKGYVEEKNIDAIAITNHNMFDDEQYYMINEQLKEIVVFPGIEINIGSNGGHMLVISEIENIDDFIKKCSKVEDLISSPKDNVTAEQFCSIFGDLNQYLLIPHYEKKPMVDKKILKAFEEYILCGEVNSVKKFVYCIKDSEMMSPVFFSDFRAKKDVDEFPTRQTFLDIDEININSIKKTVMDKQKIFLTESEGNTMFTACSDLMISTGLNVVMGERSSGKTYTLDRIFKNNNNVKYIKQFQLLERDTEEVEEKKFTETVANKRNDAENQYFEPFRKVVDDIKNISLSDDEYEILQYLNSLIKHAKEHERADLFAKCRLYSEGKYQYNSLENLKSIILAVETLLDSRQYKELIISVINKEKLIELYSVLIRKFEYEYEREQKKKWVDNLVSSIKRKLKAKSASTQVEETDFYQIQMNRKKVCIFEKIAKKVQQTYIIENNEIEGFVIRVSTEKFQGTREMQKYSKSRMKFSDAFKEYEYPYKFLQCLKQIDSLSESEYYKYFVQVKYEILNKYGYKVSGGERAEFNLLQQISDARQYDILMIDEPESSFDNIFLKDKVNHLIKDISRDMPVIVVTHNSTIGASIKPDYLIYTARNISDSKNVEYKIYTGNPSNKMLVTKDGEEIPNLQATMDCLEAGEVAYEERKRDYDILKDK